MSGAVDRQLVAAIIGRLDQPVGLAVTSGTSAVVTAVRPTASARRCGRREPVPAARRVDRGRQRAMVAGRRRAASAPAGCDRGSHGPRRRPTLVIPAQRLRGRPRLTPLDPAFACRHAAPSLEHDPDEATTTLPERRAEGEAALRVAIGRDRDLTKEEGTQCSSCRSASDDDQRPGKMNIVSPSAARESCAEKHFRARPTASNSSAPPPMVPSMASANTSISVPMPRGVDPSASMTTTRTNGPRSETRRESRSSRASVMFPHLRARPPTANARASPGRRGPDRPNCRRKLATASDSAISTEMPSISGGSPTAFER